jgi:hypothetical protein
MKHSDEIDDPRRRVLIQALASGVFAAGLAGSNALAANLFGSRPTKLASDRSIYSLTGQVTVNGKIAALNTPIRPGDVVETGKDSEIIFVINGNNSMILRGNSRLVITAPTKKSEPNKIAEAHKAEEKKSATNKTGKKVESQIEPEPKVETRAEQKAQEPESSFISGLNLFAGKLLSVSRNSPMNVNTATATIGIRGTGFYVEADPEQTYFCTCYGTTDVNSSTNPASKQTITATHHDQPVYIVNDKQGKNIRNAPLINHTDQELTLIEALVGRTTPFVFANDEYSAPRRDY